MLCREARAKGETTKRVLLGIAALFAASAVSAAEPAKPLFADDGLIQISIRGPINRVSSAEVVDGSRSVVFAQAENRLHTAVSLLAALLDGELEGATCAS